jgi:hypothetical protein
MTVSGIFVGMFRQTKTAALIQCAGVLALPFLRFKEFSA